MSVEAFNPELVFKTLLNSHFEIRLLDDGAIAIFDLYYEKGRRIREPNALLAKFVFDHAEQMGRWLERRMKE
jgi:hypothetical protein